MPTSIQRVRPCRVVWSLCVLIGLLTAANAIAAPQWRVLPNAPDRGASNRHDDLHFVDEQTGWVCNLGGEIWKTTNGGASWDIQLDIAEAFRSITFATPQRGWAGSLFDVNLLWETFDGGENWSVVPNLPTPRPSGICGLWAVNSTVVYGCGKYFGPPTLIKTINGGASWTSIDLSAYASTLIDCRFTSPDSGFVVGGLGSFPDSTRSIVLWTGDGGTSWEVRWLGTRDEEWGWKIHMLSGTDMAVSLESENGSHYFLKSANGGQTFTEHFFGSGTSYREQGIGFASPTLGWLGGASGAARETTDGGATWNLTSWGYWLNRVFMLSNSVGYAVGRTVYKYSEDDVTDVVEQPVPEAPDVSLALYPNEPNPFNPSTMIRYVIDQDATIRLLVYDVKGNLVRKLVDQLEQAGEHVVVWDGRDTSGQTVASGLYFYRLESDRFGEVRKMTLLK